VSAVITTHLHASMMDRFACGFMCTGAYSPEEYQVGVGHFGMARNFWQLHPVPLRGSINKNPTTNRTIRRNIRGRDAARHGTYAH